MGTEQSASHEGAPTAGHAATATMGRLSLHMAAPHNRPAPEALHVVQIKSRDRVRSLAEVYTHKREVDAMLDLVRGMFPSAEEPGNTDRTFLEPACGSGNFLEEILRRKLAFVTTRRYGRGERRQRRGVSEQASRRNQLAPRQRPQHAGGLVSLRRSSRDDPDDERDPGGRPRRNRGHRARRLSPRKTRHVRPRVVLP
jgi:hypothetical protein